MIAKEYDEPEPQNKNSRSQDDSPPTVKFLPSKKKSDLPASQPDEVPPTKSYGVPKPKPESGKSQSPVMKRSKSPDRENEAAHASDDEENKEEEKDTMIAASIFLPKPNRDDVRSKPMAKMLTQAYGGVRSFHVIAESMSKHEPSVRFIPTNCSTIM